MIVNYKHGQRLVDQKGKVYRVLFVYDNRSLYCLGAENQIIVFDGLGHIVGANDDTTIAGHYPYDESDEVWVLTRQIKRIWGEMW